MSKTKKIATAVVSIVLASSMCIGLAACGPEPLADSQARLEVADSYASGTNLSMNVGYQNKTPYGYITYQSNDALVSGEFELFGTRYAADRLKPAWAALEDELDVTFTDNFTNLSSDAQIAQAISDGNLATYDVITGSAKEITTNAQANTSLFLDLRMYLDYMPNYKAFLEANPIVQLSLTSDTTNGAMYYAPYFDGNDDIEKYEIANLTWIEKLLDGRRLPQRPQRLPVPSRRALPAISATAQRLRQLLIWVLPAAGG